LVFPNRRLQFGNAMKLLNAGCGTHYASGWVNTDVWNDGQTTKPDVQVETGKPYPFEENTFDAVYLGHVLEHIPWPKVFEFLQDMKRISKPDAKFLVCGPDVFKTIKRWATGAEPWWMIESTMEHQDINSQPEREHLWWDGAHHHWNCHHERVVRLLQLSGFANIQDVCENIPKDVHGKSWHHEGVVWPVVGHWHWQFAIFCRNNK